MLSHNPALTRLSLFMLSFSLSGSPVIRPHILNAIIRRHRHIARVSRLSDHFAASFFFSSVVFQIYKYNLFIMMF